MSDVCPKCGALPIDQVNDPGSESSGLVSQLLEALKGVVRVADRQTTEFDAAREAIAAVAKDRASHG